MLLPRWTETLGRHRDRIAIYEGDRALRFSDLADALATHPVTHEPVVAHGGAFDVALATLRGWRDQQPVLPLEKFSLPRLAPVPDNIAHLKLTPGSEGQPRTVRFTADQIAADADRIVDAMGLTPEVPNLAAISVTHSYGYSNVILPLLLHGIPVQTVEVPFPAVVADAWNRHERVVVPAVPSVWKAWHRSGILVGAPIRLAISAGAPLSGDLEHEVWETHQLKLHNFYGASECGGISFDNRDRPREHPDSLGEPLPGVQVDIDPDGRFLVRSSSVASDYDIHRSSGSLGDGCFLTPDHGHIEDGRLLLDTRGGTLINVAGRKLGPGRVEAVLLSTGLAKRARVFGIPSSDPERVDEVAALIEPTGSLEDLVKSASNLLDGWELPRHWLPDAPDGQWQLSREDLRGLHSKDK